MKLHAFLGHLWKLLSWCQTLTNSSASFVCIQEHLYHLPWLINVYIWSARILSGKPFSIFSMARLTTLQFRLTLTPFFTATHTFFSLFHHFYHDLWLGYLFYSRDPRFMFVIDLPWFVKFSKMANFNFRQSWFGFFFLFFWIRDQKPPTPPFKIFVYWKGVHNISKFTNIFFFNFHLYLRRHSPLACFPLNCHFLQIGFALKQVVPVLY